MKFFDVQENEESNSNNNNQILHETVHRQLKFMSEKNSIHQFKKKNKHGHH